MSELIVRGRYNDHRVIEELLSPGGLSLDHQTRLRRIVIDATVATQSIFVRAAADASIQLLIDPLTPLVRGHQAPSDAWARLSFAGPQPMTFSDLMAPEIRRPFVREVVDFQIQHGATGIIPAYIHLGELGGVESVVQRRLWDDSAQYLRALGLDIPVVPVLSVHRHAVPLQHADWTQMLGSLVASAHAISDGPLALALSASDAWPSAPALHRAIVTWRRSAQLGPFVAWNCGDLGPLAVAMGATGYETGLCGAERCDVPGRLRARENAGAPGPGWVGAYVHLLNRSLERRSVEELAKLPHLQGTLTCPDPDCCPGGSGGIAGPNRRQHAARARLEALTRLDRISAPHWKLHRLEQQAEDASLLASRLARAAHQRGCRVGVASAPYEAMATQIRSLRQIGRAAVS